MKKGSKRLKRVKQKQRTVKLKLDFFGSVLLWSEIRMKFCDVRMCGHGQTSALRNQWKSTTGPNGRERPAG